MHRFSVAALALALGVAPANAAGPPDGDYGCFVWLKGLANKVGALQIKGSAYVAGADRGEFAFEPGARLMTFKGPPPLGFKVGQLEEATSGKTVIRLYKENVGNRWGAILCSPV